MKTCSKSHSNPDDALFCNVCGEKLPTAAKKSHKVCPKCKADNPLDAQFCQNCGADLTPTPKPKPRKVCPICRAENPIEAQFCRNCRADLTPLPEPTLTPLPKPKPQPRTTSFPKPTPAPTPTPVKRDWLWEIKYWWEYKVGLPDWLKEFLVGAVLFIGGLFIFGAIIYVIVGLIRGDL